MDCGLAAHLTVSLWVLAVPLWGASKMPQRALPTSASCAKYRDVVPFELTIPDASIPVLVEIPHAGLLVPSSVQEQLSAPQDALRRDADIFVDRLCTGVVAAGAARLTAHVSRYVVDLNRAADDVDGAAVTGHPTPGRGQPRGVVWRSTTDGRAVLRRPLTYPELLDRLAQFYTPYHDALRDTLHTLQARHGYAILLAAHSMPSRGRSLHNDAGVARADIVPGTQGRTTASAVIIDAVDAHFRAAGLTVRHDDPYRGGYTTQHYGRPERDIHAVQVEISRALYVDEQTYEPLENGAFERIADLMTALVVRLGQIRP